MTIDDFTEYAPLQSGETICRVCNLLHNADLYRCPECHPRPGGSIRPAQVRRGDTVMFRSAPKSRLAESCEGQKFDTLPADLEGIKAYLAIMDEYEDALGQYEDDDV